MARAVRVARRDARVARGVSVEAPRQLRPRAAGRSSTRRWVWLAVMLQPSKLEFEAGGGVMCYSEKRLAVPKDLLPLLACSKGPAALPGVRVDCEHGRVWLRIKSGVAQQEGESTSGIRVNRFNPLVKKVRIYTVGLEIRLSVDGNSSAGLW